MKKIKFYSEFAYLVGLCALAFAASMISSTDFGLSMIIAPAYIVSQKLSFLTFGQSEYLVQAIMLIVLGIAMKGFRPLYFFSLISGVIYGTALDFWRAHIVLFNPNITPPGSMAMGLRVLFFVLGMMLTAFSVALFFKSYLYPQVYDFFIKAVSGKYGIPLPKFKTAYDFCSLGVAVVLSLLFFHRLVGVGIGTLVMACFNGTLIGFAGRMLDKVFDFVPMLPKAKELFEKLI